MLGNFKSKTPKSVTHYSIDWFRSSAIASLKKINEGTWDYSDSLLIYTPGDEKRYESIQKKRNPYAQLITLPERAYLSHIAQSIAEALPQKFDYIDLGPGTEHKEQYLFDALKSLNTSFRYIPVDIDRKYLRIAEEHAKHQGISTLPIWSSFEELPSKLLNETMPRFVSIGLTYSNYASADILPLLKAIAGERGYVFTDSQIRERVNMHEIVKVYSDEVYGLLESKIRLLGLNPRKDIAEHWCDDAIRAWCTLKRSNHSLESIGIRPGTKLLVFYFLRPTKESLQKDLSKYFSNVRLMDTGDQFVGSICN